MPIVNEDDAKHTAQVERHTPQTEKILRQFLTLESGNYVSREMRANYGTAIHGSTKLKIPMKCLQCDYVADTIAEIQWHESRNSGHFLTNVAG